MRRRLRQNGKRGIAQRADYRGMNRFKRGATAHKRTPGTHRGVFVTADDTTSAQRPYMPVSVAFAKVWKCRSNPTSAAEAESLFASGNLST